MLPPINGLFTHHAISVPVIHVDVCEITGVDGGNAIPACLRASDAAVPIVVLESEGAAAQSVWEYGGWG